MATLKELKLGSSAFLRDRACGLRLPMIKQVLYRRESSGGGANMVMEVPPPSTTAEGAVHSQR